jgi:oxygen-independent coproporphyrinogen III oxidase
MSRFRFQGPGSGGQDLVVSGQLPVPGSIAVSPETVNQNPGTEGLPGLYIHIPFCKTKCPYCDFYSVTAPDLIPAYLKAIKEEAHIYGGTGFPACAAPAEACGYREFDTLFLGGGTPSLLSAAQLAQLFDSLHRHFVFEPGTENTIEVNPDDLTAEKLGLFLDLGINRLSLGVQSFN